MKTYLTARVLVNGGKRNGCDHCAGGRARWMVVLGPRGEARWSFHCNGCFMRHLQDMYSVAAGYRHAGSGLPEEVNVG